MYSVTSGVIIYYLTTILRLGRIRVSVVENSRQQRHPSYTLLFVSVEVYCYCPFSTYLNSRNVIRLTEGLASGKMNIDLSFKI